MFENIDHFNEILKDMQKRREERKQAQREEDKITPLEERVRAHQDHIKEQRRTWGRGRWTNEPDRKEFSAHGFDCLIIRAPLGNLCGYVGLPPEHPLYGKNYNELEETGVDLDVHGGITYSEECGGHICHRPRAGGPDHVHWLGFDCAHGDDFLPNETSVMQRYIKQKVAAEMRQTFGESYDFDRIDNFFGRKTYKPLNWVEMETKRLARQLRQLAESHVS